MAGENCNRYQVKQIELGEVGQIEIRTLGNASTLCLDSNLRSLPANFWLDLHFAFESEFSLKINNILTFPGRIGTELKEVILILHEPKPEEKSRLKITLESPDHPFVHCRDS